MKAQEWIKMVKCGACRHGRMIYGRDHYYHGFVKCDFHGRRKAGKERDCRDFCRPVLVFGRATCAADGGIK